MIFFLNINCFEIAYPISESIVFSFYGFNFKDDFFLVQGHEIRKSINGRENCGKDTFFL